MDIRVLFFLFVLSTGWCCSARVVPTQTGIASEMEINHQQHDREVEAAEQFGRNKELCTLCEEFAALSLGYLAKNKTQTEIISILHKSCSKLLSLEQQCIILVDYYAPLLFLEVSMVQPEEFCRKIDICQPVVSIPQHLSKGSCEFCQHIVSQALQNLKDPDTELDIVELLLKVCDVVEGNVKKCKRLVFEYAPLVISNAEKYLEKHDVCAMLHACSSATTTTDQASSSQTSMHSAY